MSSSRFVMVDLVLAGFQSFWAKYHLKAV
jgi:hypothetical protein